MNPHISRPSRSDPRVFEKETLNAPRRNFCFRRLAIRSATKFRGVELKDLEGFVEAHFYPFRTMNYFAIPKERRLEIRDRVPCYTDEDDGGLSVPWSTVARNALHHLFGGLPTPAIA
jgi:hypothetical protein